MKVPNSQIHGIKHPLNNQQKNQKIKNGNSVRVTVIFHSFLFTFFSYNYGYFDINLPSGPSSVTSG